MFGASVDLELLDHGVAETALREHALDGNFQSAARMLGLHFCKSGGVHAAGIARVAVVGLLACQR